MELNYKLNFSPTSWVSNEWKEFWFPRRISSLSLSGRSFYRLILTELNTLKMWPALEIYPSSPRVLTTQTVSPWLCHKARTIAASSTCATPGRRGRGPSGAARGTLTVLCCQRRRAAQARTGPASHITTGDQSGETVTSVWPHIDLMTSVLASVSATQSCSTALNTRTALRICAVWRVTAVRGHTSRPSGTFLWWLVTRTVGWIICARYLVVTMRKYYHLVSCQDLLIGDACCYDLSNPGSGEVGYKCCDHESRVIPPSSRISSQEISQVTEFDIL